MRFSYLGTTVTNSKNLTHKVTSEQNQSVYTKDQTNTANRANCKTLVETNKIIQTKLVIDINALRWIGR